MQVSNSLRHTVDFFLLFSDGVSAALANFCLIKLCAWGMNRSTIISRWIGNCIDPSRTGAGRGCGPPKSVHCWPGPA